MSVRDLLLNILIVVGIAAFIFIGSAIDSFPISILVILAIIVWIAYLILVIRDHQRDIRYPIVRIRPNEAPRRVVKTPQNTPYDQEEDI